MNKSNKTKTKVIKPKQNNISLYEYDQALYNDQIRYIAGVDEVGRGALAGPVVACCLILKKGFYDPLVNDSKKVAKKHYRSLANLIKQNCVAYGIGVVDSQTIDQINILNATKLAMLKAVEQVLETVNIDLLLIDALQVDLDLNQKEIIKGDQTSFSIAAASIVAKDFRDQLMVEYDQLYPSYGFAKNVGYGTKNHFNAIEQYGITQIHRLSFNHKKSKI
ncbi:ribonuclease HII [Ureaplasma diversum]|uniref:Ribonuclease n=1 Tax=Ureaplasma diversum NCTC 246 TaxID=1188241 RepID=A0A084F054_9BACT|nr:ribonuclease HII [Ureaplasma diversum]KEZ23596.1 Ribonuclease HII [Ureaplasma diversum NCTC 246]